MPHPRSQNEMWKSRSRTLLLNHYDYLSGVQGVAQEIERLSSSLTEPFKTIKCCFFPCDIHNNSQTTQRTSLSCSHLKVGLGRQRVRSLRLTISDHTKALRCSQFAARPFCKICDDVRHLSQMAIATSVTKSHENKGQPRGR